MKNLFDKICESNLLYKQSARKFKEIDVNSSGKIEQGKELLDLAEWILKDSSLKPNYQPTMAEKKQMCVNILQRFEKGENDGLNLMEMAVLQSESMVLHNNFLSSISL